MLKKILKIRMISIILASFILGLSVTGISFMFNVGNNISQCLIFYIIFIVGCIIGIITGLKDMGLNKESIDKYNDNIYITYKGLQNKTLREIIEEDFEQLNDIDNLSFNTLKNIVKNHKEI